MLHIWLRLIFEFSYLLNLPGKANVTVKVVGQRDDCVICLFNDFESDVKYFCRCMKVKLILPFDENHGYWEKKVQFFDDIVFDMLYIYMCTEYLTDSEDM